MYQQDCVPEFAFSSFGLFELLALDSDLCTDITDLTWTLLASDPSRMHVHSRRLVRITFFYDSFLDAGLVPHGPSFLFVFIPSWTTSRTARTFSPSFASMEPRRTSLHSLFILHTTSSSPLTFTDLFSPDFHGPLLPRLSRTSYSSALPDIVLGLLHTCHTLAVFARTLHPLQLPYLTPRPRITVFFALLLYPLCALDCFPAHPIPLRTSPLRFSLSLFLYAIRTTDHPGPLFPFPTTVVALLCWLCPHVPGTCHTPWTAIASAWTV
jgi:hypothetical protein